MISVQVKMTNWVKKINFIRFSIQREPCSTNVVSALKEKWRRNISIHLRLESYSDPNCSLDIVGANKGMIYIFCLQEAYSYIWEL